MGYSQKDLVTIKVDQGLKQEVDSLTSQLASKTNKGELFVSVKDYKCSDGQYVKGDGIHDDTTGIQAAIDDAVATKSTLFIPQGVYKTTGTLYIRNSVRLFGAFETGWTGKGSVIKYYGTGTALECATVTHSGTQDIFGIKLESFRIDSAEKLGQYGIKIKAVSEMDIIGVHVTNGFDVGIYVDGLTIANFERCTLSENDIGIHFARATATVQTMGVTVRGCDFWKNSLAQIKLSYGIGVNIVENWMEYSAVGILIENTGNNAEITNVVIEKNIITTNNATLYPNSRSIKIVATNATYFLQVLNLIVRNNLLYSVSTDYVVEIDLTQSNGNSYAKGFIEKNLIWGGQTSGIHSAGTPTTFKTIFTVVHNEYRTAYLGSFNTTGITGDILRYGVMATQPASVATTVDQLKTDFNTLLTSIKNAQFMNSNQ